MEEEACGLDLKSRPGGWADPRPTFNVEPTVDILHWQDETNFAKKPDLTRPFSCAFPAIDYSPRALSPIPQYLNTLLRRHVHGT